MVVSEGLFGLGQEHKGPLARAIHRLVSDDALRTSLADDAVPLERYDWPAVLARTESVYRRASARAGIESPVAAASA